METARRSGDGELVPALGTSQKIKVTKLQIGSGSAATITLRSDGAAGTILREFYVPASQTLSFEAGELCITAANENLYIAASAGTVKAWCEYTSEN